MTDAPLPADQRLSKSLALVARLREIGGQCDVAEVAEAIDSILLHFAWRPISTAPVNTEILCWWQPVASNGPPACGLAVRRPGTGWSKPDSYDDDYRTPSHWMPKPEAPRS